MKQPTIADALCRSQLPAQFKITAGHRVYYNYNIDAPSREAEIANVGSRRTRDFRSMREKSQDPDGA